MKVHFIYGNTYKRAKKVLYKRTTFFEKESMQHTIGVSVVPKLLNNPP